MEESPVESRKASSYQQDKSAKWQSKANSSQDGQLTTKAGQESNCTYCGRKSHPRDQCPAKEKECSKCGKKGHFKAVCRSGDRGRSRSRGRNSQQTNQTEAEEPGVRSGRVSMNRGRSRSVHMPAIRCGRVAARRVTDDAEPTPLMEDVIIKPNCLETSRTKTEHVPGALSL